MRSSGVRFFSRVRGFPCFVTLRSFYARVTVGLYCFTSSSIRAFSSRCTASVPANPVTCARLVEYTNEELAKPLWRRYSRCQRWGRRIRREGALVRNATKRCSAALRSDGGDRLTWVSGVRRRRGPCGECRHYYTISSRDRARRRGKRKAHDGAARRASPSSAKRDKSGALTAGTFERRNPVMQIRFSGP